MAVVIRVVITATNQVTTGVESEKRMQLTNGDPHAFQRVEERGPGDQHLKSRSRDKSGIVCSCQVPFQLFGSEQGKVG